MLKWLSLFLILTSCIDRPQKSEVLFSSPDTRAEEQRLQQEEEERLELQRQREFEQEKKETWTRITLTARETFKDVEPIFSKKCFDCHDSSRRLPLYGRILPRINPVNAHQRDGLEVLDMVNTFPIDAIGSPKQISLLTAIKNSVLEKTMPLKSYTFIYRSRKINSRDQEKIVAWVDPLIQEIQDYYDRFEPDFDDGSFRFKAKKIFEAKCFRCHANGISKGNFGGMEDLEKLKNSKYVDLNSPLNSDLYKIVESGEMPTNPREMLSDEELSYVLEWIKEVI